MSASGERYRRQEALLEILMDRRNIGSQTELQELLRERGIEATQSSVSRDLKDLGIKRVKGRYVLPPWRAVGEGDFKLVVGFVQSAVPADERRGFFAWFTGNHVAATLVARWSVGVGDVLPGPCAPSRSAPGAPGSNRRLAPGTLRSRAHA